jgi:hypothetical protein
MSDAQREMTLAEWCGRLPLHHTANIEHQALLCRVAELESQMQGLSNEINDFQNIIERQKREIHELQCQQDTPLAFYDISHDEDGEVEYEFSVYPRPGFKPLYTQAVAKGEQT